MRKFTVNEEYPGNTDAGAIMKKFVYMSLFFYAHSIAMKYVQIMNKL